MNEAIFESSSMTRMRMGVSIRREDSYGNSKSEARNSKFETNPKLENRISKIYCDRAGWFHDNFNFRISNLLRVSDFGFRVLTFKNPPGRSPIGAGGFAVC